jgi:poly(beta-D-mannuronate) lyase
MELVDWSLSVPEDLNQDSKADNISEVELTKGYRNQQYFWSSIDDEGLVFKAPIGGPKTSTNTSFTRSELREMLRRGNTKIATQGINKNNWVFGKSNMQLKNVAGGIDGELNATLMINHVTTTGSAKQVGRVIIGQIHAKDNEPCRLYYRLLPGYEKGPLYFAHETIDGLETYYELLGSRSSTAPEPVDGVALNERFSYRIKVDGDILIVTIFRSGKNAIEKRVSMKSSGYTNSTDYMYFKVGVYNQNNTGDSTDYVQATFYEIKNSHSGYEY